MKIFNERVFCMVSESFKGGWVMSLDYISPFWYIVLSFNITMSPHCLGEVGSFGCDPRIHGAEKICFVL